MVQVAFFFVLCLCESECWKMCWCAVPSGCFCFLITDNTIGMHFEAGKTRERRE